MAELHVLHEGYIRDGGERVGATVSLILDGEARIVVDPGLVREPGAILGPLARLGMGPGDVTDVVLSHHHPDHTRFAGLFPEARVHDHWAWYRGDRWVARPAERFALSPHVELLATPGHTEQDVSTVVRTPEGLVVLTHLWWHAGGPAEDPYAPDPSVLHASRERVLALPGLIRIVPGHGPPFAPSPHTPR